MLKRFLTFIIVAFALVSGCKKEPEEVSPDKTEVGGRYLVYVLNEGLFNSNNSTLTAFEPDSSIVRDNYFYQTNNRKLGDTGNDIAVYGSKMYIVVNVSSQLEVVDAKSCRSLKQISFFNGGVARQPRNIAFSGAYAFVCSFDGSVAVIDTTSLSVVKYLQAGRNPEDLVVQNNKLYVSNSGGLDAPEYDKTVSVFSISTFEKLNDIEVGENPGSIAADRYGDVYVVTGGAYGVDNSAIYIIDSKSDTVKRILPYKAGGIALYGDSLFVTRYNGKKGISLINTVNEEVIAENFIDGESFQTLYGIDVDPFTGEIYCSDAKGYVNQGKVLVFDRSGKKIEEFEAGLNPGHFAFYHTNLNFYK